jgi:hypothetical protein
MSNWEKKSAYLLREIVKFKTYVDSLKAAQQQKEVLGEEREARAAEKAALFANAEATAQQQQHLEASSSGASAHSDIDPAALEPTQPPPPPPQTARSV